MELRVDVNEASKVLSGDERFTSDMRIFGVHGDSNVGHTMYDAFGNVKIEMKGNDVTATEGGVLVVSEVVLACISSF